MLVLQQNYKSESPSMTDRSRIVSTVIKAMVVLAVVVAGYLLLKPAAPKTDAVMLGDSITQGGNWVELFPGLKIVNRGIAGNKTSDIQARLDQVFGDQPREVFLMAGINDLVQGVEVDQVFGNLIDIVHRLQQKKIKVHLQSTLECSRVQCGAWLDKVRTLNGLLRDYAAKNSIVWININQGITSEAEGLLGFYTNDGFHLTDSGYLAWSKTLAPYMNRK